MQAKYKTKGGEGKKLKNDSKQGLCKLVQPIQVDT